MTASGRIAHANCFLPADLQADALVTDEALVAEAVTGRLPVIAAEDGMDAEVAHATSIAMLQAACRWYRAGERDCSVVAGISAGDLASTEAALSVLVPAARGVLAMSAALARGLAPSTLVSVAPAGNGRYERLETLAANTAVAAARSHLGTTLKVERARSGEPRNACLREKYARVRDAEHLAPTPSRRRVQQALALAAANLPARASQRVGQTLLVVEYHPTRAFARLYGQRRRKHKRWRLVCWPAQPRELLAIAAAADQALLLPVPDVRSLPPSGAGQRLRAHLHELAGGSLRVAGVDLWPIVREPLIALVERYGRYVAALAPLLACELERRSVSAVLVPFDSPPHARLIVRVSQTLGIPTFVINDGYKADEIQQEGMAADFALAWSEPIRDSYFARRADGAVVTGNPRSERLSHVVRIARDLPRVLVGAHAFSPVDINCGRSDAERFMEEILLGIAAAQAHVSARVLVKLHPADAPTHYRGCLARHARMSIELHTGGDVVDLFDECDVYVSTYSTSLIEAAAAGLPIVYYRVNQQRLGPPFAADEYLSGRCVASPEQLSQLLADRDELTRPAPHGWAQRYLGPTDGAVDRVLAAIEARVPARARR